MPGMPVMRLADEARDIARELIPQHHVHLLTAHILYVFTDQERKRCDRVRLGSSAKMTSVQRFLASGFDGVEHGPDFLILIDSVRWADMTKKQKTALVDHELCHCALWVKDHSETPAQWVRWLPDMQDPQEYEEQRWSMRGLCAIECEQQRYELTRIAHDLSKFWYDRKRGVPSRPAARRCTECHRLFVPAQITQQFCTQRCRKRDNKRRELDALRGIAA